MGSKCFLSLYMYNALLAYSLLENGLKVTQMLYVDVITAKYRQLIIMMFLKKTAQFNTKP